MYMRLNIQCLFKEVKSNYLEEGEGKDRLLGLRPLI